MNPTWNFISHVLLNLVIDAKTLEMKPVVHELREEKATGPAGPPDINMNIDSIIWCNSNAGGLFCQTLEQAVKWLPLINIWVQLYLMSPESIALWHKKYSNSQHYSHLIQSEYMTGTMPFKKMFNSLHLHKWSHMEEESSVELLHSLHFTTLQLLHCLCGIRQVILIDVTSSELPCLQRCQFLWWPSELPYTTTSPFPCKRTVSGSLAARLLWWQPKTNFFSI